MRIDYRKMLFFLLLLLLYGWHKIRQQSLQSDKYPSIWNDNSSCRKTTAAVAVIVALAHTLTCSQARTHIIAITVRHIEFTGDFTHIRIRQRIMQHTHAHVHIRSRVFRQL